MQTSKPCPLGVISGTVQNVQNDSGLSIRELMATDPVGSRALVRAKIRRIVDYCVATPCAPINGDLRRRRH
jgi:hypothetical protein